MVKDKDLVKLLVIKTNLPGGKLNIKKKKSPLKKFYLKISKIFYFQLSKYLNVIHYRPY